MTTYPEKTLFYSMVPLAWALRSAGHDVRVASQPFFCDTITRAGLTAVSVGRDRRRPTERMMELDPEQNEDDREGLPDPYNAAARDPARLDWAAMRDGYDFLLHTWHKLENFPMLAELVTFARQWRPDLVLWEPSTYAGPIAAKASGAAHGRLLWSIDVFGVARERFLALTPDPAHERPDPLAGWLESYARRYDFAYDEDLITGQFTVDQLPDSLRMKADLEYVPMRYVPYNATTVVPDWLRRPPDRPRVAVTLGITATDVFGGYKVNLQDLLDQFAGLDVELVATVAASERGKLTRVPANARVLPWVPLHPLAQSCAAVVNHAGPGTALTTAICGVPQLHLPWDFDEPELSRRFATQGSALSLDAGTATGEQVREAVQRLLDEPDFGVRAAALRREIGALPSPNSVVQRLVELVDAHRPG
ncbi:activator-dependent family glycosyltransferase [Micromonospora sp. NPDC047793]|uniref:activator-dependent family glycosyltransferase n=1 Tax=unclassified Micromonospora TaxID=2617518 RepID=UPI00191418A5|nr:activator-dependent family glycosyltransferase [Verrucosispora sp. SN26_14.1]